MHMINGFMKMHSVLVYRAR